MSRTPVSLVAGQRLTDAVCAGMLGTSGTAVVEHHFDGHVVVRSVRVRRDDAPSAGVHRSEFALELINCCVDCTVRNDLLVLLRRLHRRDDVHRIVVQLAPWAEPETVCWAINNLDVRVGPGYADGPAALDVRIDSVISTVDCSVWLTDALSADQLEDDDRTVAQVVVGQAEFADVVVLSEPDRRTEAVLSRLAPRASIVVGTAAVDRALEALGPDARRGRDHDPHESLLSGEPPLSADGDVRLVEFRANRPFHPARLHDAIEELLDGVVRLRGRGWLASQPDAVVWMESAGGGLCVGHAGTWLAAAAPDQTDAVDPTRALLADLWWDPEFGDRHVSLTILVCGADPGHVTRTLARALVSDEELENPHTWSAFDDPFGDWHEDPCLSGDVIDVDFEVGHEVASDVEGAIPTRPDAGEP